MAAQQGPGEAKHGFSYWVAVCFAINLIIGGGILAIPQGLVKAGTILGPILLCIMVYFCNVTKDWLLEGLARVHHLRKRRKAGEAGTAPGPLVLGDEVMELTEAVGLLAGPTLQGLYLGAVYLWTLGTMWSFTAIFASSFAGHVPVVFLPAPHNTVCDINTHGSECVPQYLVYVAVFALLVVPLTLMDMTEQVIVQIIMAGGRMVLAVLMAATAMAGWGCDGVAFKAVAAHSGGRTPPVYDVEADPAGLGALIPLAVTAAAFHQAIPSITRDTADKSTMGSVLRTSFIIVGSVYVVFGVILTLFFGAQVEPQASLLWTGYVGCEALPPNATSLPPDQFDAAVEVLQPSGWAQFVSFFVLIFPALDVASAFPLNGIALANNILAVFYPGKAQSSQGGGEGSGRDPEAETAPLTAGAPSVQTGAGEGSAGDEVGAPPRWARRGAKLLAAIAPLVGACFVSRLDHILEITGTLAVFMVYTFPALVAQLSHGAALRPHQGLHWWAVASVGSAAPTPPPGGAATTSPTATRSQYTALTSPKARGGKGSAPRLPTSASLPPCERASRLLRAAVLGSRAFAGHPTGEGGAETVYSPACSSPAACARAWTVVPGASTVLSLILWGTVLTLVLATWE